MRTAAICAIVFVLILNSCLQPAEYDMVADSVKAKFEAEKCILHPGTHVNGVDTFSILKLELTNLSDLYSPLSFWSNSSASALIVYQEIGEENLNAYDGIDVTINDQTGVGLAKYTEGNSIAYTLAALRSADSIRLVCENILKEHRSSGSFKSSRTFFDSVINDTGLSILDSVVLAETKYDGDVLEMRVIGFRYAHYTGYDEDFTVIDVAEHTNLDRWNVYRFTFNDKTRRFYGIEFSPKDLM